MVTSPNVDGDSSPGGAIGAANGNAQAGVAVIHGVMRQPEAGSRLSATTFLVIGLCEAAYFINLAFMAVFVFAPS